MSLERLQTFIGYLRSNKLMEQAEIIRVVRQMQQLDRRVGMLAVLRGYIQPEDISKVTLTQTQIGRKFLELAVELGNINPAQSNEILKLQADDLFSFSQAAVMVKVRTLPDMIGYLKIFLQANPAKAEEKIEGKRSVSADVREALKKIQGVAPLPGVVTKVTGMLDDPKVTMEAIGKVIMLDAGLVTTLLRLVNSAFFGMRSKVQSITQALVVLGTKKVKEIVLVAGVMQKFKDVPAKEAAAFWERALYSGQWCKELASYFKFDDIDQMFINGFIHDVGELVILQHFPEKMQVVAQLLEKGYGPANAEREAVGASHADISAFLFEIWKFSPAMVQSATLHHHPLEHLKQLKSVKREAVMLNMVSQIVDLDRTLDPYERIARMAQIIQDYGEILPMGDLVIEEISDKVETAVTGLKALFNLKA